MIEVYIDGASAGNPGPSGAGIFIKGQGAHEKYSLPLGIMSNHEAEFHALIKALEICQKKTVFCCLFSYGFRVSKSGS